MKLLVYSSADVSPCSDRVLTESMFYVSSSMFEHSFINWKRHKACAARVYASIFAVKNYRGPGYKGNELVALLVPTNQVYRSSCFILTDVHVLSDAGLMAQTSHLGGWVSCTCISSQPSSPYGDHLHCLHVCAEQLCSDPSALAPFCSHHQTPCISMFRHC